MVKGRRTQPMLGGREWSRAVVHSLCWEGGSGQGPSYTAYAGREGVVKGRRTEPMLRGREWSRAVVHSLCWEGGREGGSGHWPSYAF